ncbi:hypothetical protein HK099_005112 [Clydaea vesicula]|uniref:RCK N-terminal domain-containing protein n=1 Tax=Clydaea vesicula TaxID=447962 RepID=A0AAD5U2U9_9FUNG|nr:hypothetical protein HK099_005112 [Clydaea vesicula]
MTKSINSNPLIAQADIGGSSYDVASSSSFAFPPNLADNRERLAFYLDSTKVGRWWEVFDTILNSMLCINYVFLTQFKWKNSLFNYNSIFHPNDVYKFQLLDLVLAITLLLQHLPMIYVSFDRVGSCLSLYSVLTFAATISVFCAFFELNNNSLTFLGSGYWSYDRKHSISESLAPNKNFIFNLSSVTHKGIHILVAILVTLVTIAAWVHLILIEDEKVSPKSSFFDVFYTITLSATNGLDTDIVPDNNTSRIATLAIMIIGAIYIPKSLSEFLTLLKQQSKYDKPYNSALNNETESSLFKHVILAGNINDVGALRSFLREFFCEDHGPQTITTKLVILQPFEPSEELELILNDVAYKSKVQYIKGSIISFSSLQKARADTADACFLLTSKFGTDGDLEDIDANTILRAHAIKKYNPRLPLFVQVLLPRNIVLFQNLAEHVLCIDSYKLGILSQNALAPGFINLITMLTTSFSDASKKFFYYKNSKFDEWIQEYIAGSTQEIYTVRLYINYKGQLFENLASNIYQKYGALLFGIGYESKKNNSNSFQISLNPAGYVFKGTEMGYLITSEKFLAEKIAKGEGLKEEEFRNDYDVNSILSFDFPEIEVEGIDEINEASTSTNLSSVTEKTPLLEKIGNREKGFINNASDEMLYSENVERMRQNISGALRKCNNSGSLSDLLYRGPKIEGNNSQPENLRKLSSLQFLNNLSQDSSIFDLSNLNVLPEFVKKHVLICDLSSSYPANLAYFVAVYRHKDPFTPIVLLSKEKPGVGVNDENDDGTLNQESWKYLEQYSNIFHVSGTPLKRKDLLAAKVESISSAIILCDPFAYESGDRLADAAGLHSLLSIEELSPKGVFISIEFVHEENMKIIGKEDYGKGPSSVTLENFGAAATPSFISGNCFGHFVLHSLLCQVYYNDEEEYEEDEEKKIKKFFFNQLNNFNLTYHQLFLYLLKTKSCLPIALYRRINQTNETQHYYTVLNPSFDLSLRHDDRIFVLSRYKLVDDY